MVLNFPLPVLKPLEIIPATERVIKKIPSIFRLPFRHGTSNLIENVTKDA